jgi:hypothetical protein
MIGNSDPQTTVYCRVSHEKFVPAKHPFRAIEPSIDTAKIHGICEYSYAPIGRPSIPPVLEEKIQAISSRIRSWAEKDDGKPVYMFNLIHFFPEYRTFPGPPEFKGTPEEANAYYDKAIGWLWLSHASYPLFSGSPQADNLINMQPEREREKPKPKSRSHEETRDRISTIAAMPLEGVEPQTTCEEVLSRN